MKRCEKKVLWTVCVSAQGNAAFEEVLCALMEVSFGMPPSVYTDAESQRIKATVYLGKKLNGKELDDFCSEVKELASETGCGELPLVTFKRIRQEDWAESWKRHFKAIRFGKKLVVRPSWIKTPKVPGQKVVVLDPGLSFGTGQHPTTHYCLKCLLGVRSDKKEQSFLDIGTGSGILAVAAVKLGYQPVEGFDFDGDCIRVARENAAKNRVGHLVQFKKADLTKLPMKCGKQYDFICANLIYDLLIQERARITHRLSKSGRLVLAGILDVQFEGVQRAYEEIGLKCEGNYADKEWRSGLFRWG